MVECDGAAIRKTDRACLCQGGNRLYRDRLHI